MSATTTKTQTKKQQKTYINPNLRVILYRRLRLSLINNEKTWGHSLYYYRPIL
jgi:hypothetical protein